MNTIVRALSLVCLLSMPAMQAAIEIKKYLWHVPAMAVVLSHLAAAEIHITYNKIDSLTKVDNILVRHLSIATMAGVYAYQHLCQANPTSAQPVQPCKCPTQTAQNKLSNTTNSAALSTAALSSSTAASSATSATATSSKIDSSASETKRKPIN